MPNVTLELTESEARIVVRALDIAVSYINSGEPFDGILEEFDLTPEETEAFRTKMQARKDAFDRRLSAMPGYGEVTNEPIDWPPTDEAIIEFVSGAIEQQLPQG
jgi:hypothetical protein